MTKEQAINYLKSSGFSDEQIEAVTEALSEERKRGWIPVTERLPKEIGDYIVTKIDDENVKVIGLCYFSFWGWTTNKEVIAWMPLPKPYEGSDRDAEKL